MQTFVRWLREKPTSVPRWLPAAILLLAFIGFADATYLTVVHYRGEVPTCSIIKGCDVVTTSVYATLGSIPTALLGALFYVAIIFLTVAYFDTRRTEFLKIVALMTIGGLLFSLWLTYLQFFVLFALCQYCILSALTSTLLFIGGLIILSHSYGTNT